MAALLARVTMPKSHKSSRETSADNIGPHAILACSGDTAAALRTQIRRLQQTAWDPVCVIERDERLIGLVLALPAFPMVWLVFGELRLAAAVTLALAGASVVASTLGLLLPWLLARVGSDPAYGSGPLATIVQDVLSLLIYFGCFWAIML